MKRVSDESDAAAPNHIVNQTTQSRDPEVTTLVPLKFP